ncbi:lipid-A-disaccharide kinase [Balneicella halophila]|uniref:Tetraacyldisaccharide 4'-kinase n=1 Tax=Balneicella halophila TaxID=1537566 RepID=A0A7L4UN98_BALHA|nr:tetraacyldisaccharide 4'-kinase [Balneicella halophila]PVX50101.1 lipid-A-disaccharide kinase [Balneicella halophila]
MKSKSIDTLRSVLFPFSWLYGLIFFIRNRFYDLGIFKSKSFSTPVVCVGNITVGGTGKTPHVEYLIHKYKQDYKIAVLSRGYGRKTKGFRYVNLDDNAKQVGDEPLQMKLKFPEITFAVDEKRVHGIEVLQKAGYNLILLDDAFQHRAVKPSKSIVLIDYNRMPYDDCFLPTGNLREGRRALKRADIVLVTKCPKIPSDKEKTQIVHKNRVVSPLFFTHFEYGSLHSYKGVPLDKSLKNLALLLVTGIANPMPLLDYLHDRETTVHHLPYPDHYDFLKKDLLKIQEEFEKVKTTQKIILTTEKDKVKLLPLISGTKLASYFYYIPIKVAFETEGAEKQFHHILSL